MTIELNGSSEGSKKIIVPMLITNAALDIPIIRYNVSELLLNDVATEKPENNLMKQLSASFPKVTEPNLDALVDAASTESEIYLSSVKHVKET